MLRLRKTEAPYTLPNIDYLRIETKNWDIHDGANV